MEELSKPEYNYLRCEKESSTENGSGICEEVVSEESDSQSSTGSSDNNSLDDPKLKGKRSRLPFVYIECRYINRRYKAYLREHPSYSCVEIAKMIHYELYESPIPSDEVTVIRELIGWGREGEDRSNRREKSVLNHIYNYRKQHHLVRRRRKKSQRRRSNYD